MLQIKRVLHATDFSPSARSAMEFSLLLAQLLDARVDVLHVVSSVGPHRVDEYEAAEGAELSTSDRAVAEGFASLQAMSKDAGTAVRFLVGRGPLPGPVILDEAMRDGANLIVLGAHGGGEAELEKLGSVSTDIVRRSTCPVLIIPPHVSEGTVDEEMENVVTFISYARLIEPVIGVAIQLADMLGARLDVLAQVNGGDPQHTDTKWEHVEKNLWELLERNTKENASTLPLGRIGLHPVAGNAVEEILRFAKDRSADLMILEAPGLASMDSPFEQTVEEIVGRSPCPVILVNVCGRPLTPRMQQNLRVAERSVV